MKLNILPVIREALRDERGQALPWLVCGMIGFLGVSGLSIDVGHAYVVRSQLVGATNAAALAGAEALPNISATSQSLADSAAGAAAAAYGAATGGANTNPTLGTVNITSTVWCSSVLLASGIPCSGSANANVIRVTQTASVPTTFLRALGVNQLTVSTTSTASRAEPMPYNIALIVDTTLSMNAQDSNCGATQMSCALNGVQQMLSAITPSKDPVSLFTFPNVTTDSALQDYSCTTSIPSTYPYKGKTYSSTNYPPYGQIVMLPNPPYSDNAVAFPYSFPPVGATSYAPSVKGITYQIVPFLQDYRTSDTGPLNMLSNLVTAAGGKSGCGGMTTSNYDGNYGTYYAGAIYAAQAALVAQQPNNPKSENVIIILGDGDSTAPANSSMPGNSTNATASYTDLTGYTLPSGYSYANSSGKYPSWEGECGQAVDAAAYATAQGTKVFSVAYGASTSGCASDQSPNSSLHPGISPCETMRQIASLPKYYYSDYNATGGDTNCKSSQSVTALNDIFTSIAANLQGARLIPNSTQ